MGKIGKLNSDEGLGANAAMQQVTATKDKVRKDDNGNNFWERELDGSSPGPIFSTSVYAMILAMPYHYIPLYQR